MATKGSHIKRPRYFDRQQLTAEDLALGQHYHIARTKQLNQHLHGWGVVCGALLDVGSQGNISLDEGFAVSPSGCSMLIPALKSIDLYPLIQNACPDAPTDCDKLVKDIDIDRTKEDYERGYSTSDEPVTLYLIARPVEQATEPKPSIPADCSHQGNTMEFSRLCESVCLDVVCHLPHLHQREPIPCEALHALFCHPANNDLGKILKQHFACPETIPPEHDYVVLASLITQLMPNERRRVIDGLSYDSRRILMPTHLLQQYLSCLCERPQPTPSPTPTKTRTATPTTTFTRLPTQTFTRVPTQTMTRLPTQTISGIPTLTITRLPTERPTGFPTRFPTEFPGDFPIGSLTRPIDPLIIDDLDVLSFDPIRGLNTNINELVLLGEEQKSSLRELGIKSVLDLYIADTNEVASKLNLSEVRVAEYRDNALTSMRRGKTIELDDTAFDLEKGMRASIEEVHNVGRTRGRKLTNAGYSSVADMANAQPDVVAEILSVSPKTAQQFINDAQSKMRK